jgi:hypothetical protein
MPCYTEQTGPETVPQAADLRVPLTVSISESAGRLCPTSPKSTNAKDALPQDVIPGLMDPSMDAVG